MPVRRISVPWNAVEPAPGVWDWSLFDAYYQQMRAVGLRPLIVAGAPPCWTRPGAQCDATQGPPDPSYDPAWKTYVGVLAQRYPAAVGIEVWNEPNTSLEFVPRVDPVRYTALLKEAYEAVKSVDSGLSVISGGLFASDTSGPYAMGDGAFLKAMYAAGARGFMDGIGAHPYPVSAAAGGRDPRYDLAALTRDLDRLRAVRDGEGDRATPIWITETGVSTASAPGSPPGTSEQDQRFELLKLLDLIGRQEDVRVALIHRLDDVQPATANPALSPVESGFGVFRSDGTPKPAACALGRRFDGTLTC